MFGVPSVAGRPLGSDRSRGGISTPRRHPLVHHPRPRPLFVLLFVVHGNRYTCFLIHAKKGPMNDRPLTSRQTRSRWGYGVADRASRPVNR